jgi:hypothetical protein
LPQLSVFITWHRSLSASVSANQIDHVSSDRGGSLIALCGEVFSGSEWSNIKNSFKGDNGKWLLWDLEEVFLKNKCGLGAIARVEIEETETLKFTRCDSLRLDMPVAEFNYHFLFQNVSPINLV